MKKCPFCKAEIEENARFCLYCMKPLGEKEIIPPPKEKKRWWLLAVAIVLFLAVFVAIIWLTGRQGEEADPSTGNSSNTGDTASQTEAASGETDPTDDATIEDPGTTPIGKPGGNVSTRPGLDADFTVPPYATRPTVPAQPSSSQSSNATQPTSEPTMLPATQTTYIYRTATKNDVRYVYYENTNDDVVITGIATPVPDGVYHIPSYIDGRRVIAISNGTFYGSNLVSIYLPTTLHTVDENTFYGSEVKHIYFTHNVALYDCPDWVTIHCPKSCYDMHYNYYSNPDVAEFYKFYYEEWNG